MYDTSSREEKDAKIKILTALKKKFPKKSNKSKSVCQVKMMEKMFMMIQMLLLLLLLDDDDDDQDEIANHDDEIDRMSRLVHTKRSQILFQIKIRIGWLKT